MRLRHALPAFLVIATMLGAGCRGSSARVPNEFRWADTDPQYIDPTLVQDTVSWQLAVNLFEGLTCQPAGEGSPLPCGARDWTVSDDGLTWTFRLRPNARWSDGKPVTAADYAFGIRRLSDAELGAAYRDLVRVIKGGPDVLEGRPLDEPFGVDVMSDYELRIRLEHPVPYLTQLVSMPAFFPIRKDLIEEHGRKWVLPENIRGNGPFKLTEKRTLDRIVLDRNELYWDADKVHLDRATQLISDNSATIYRMYEAGEIDWVNEVPRAYLSKLLEKRPDDLFLTATYSTYRVDFNTEQPPFDDPRVRRAFALAVDRQALVNHVTRGGELPARGIVPPMNMPELRLGTAPPDPDFRPEEAKALLTAAGYPGGRGLPSVTYLYNTAGVNRLVAETLQQMWQDNLGVSVTLENIEFKVFLDRKKYRDFQFARAAWLGDFIDPVTFLDEFRSEELNDTGWSDPEFHLILARADVEANAERRLSLLRRAEEVLLRDAPTIALYHGVDPQLLRPGIEGFGHNRLGAHLLRYVQMPGGTGE